MSLSRKLKLMGKSTREFAESIVFAVFTESKATKVFLSGPAHIVFFPLIILGMGVNLVSEVLDYRKARNKSIFNSLSLGLVTIMSGLAITSLLGTLIMADFALGPVLFVSALTIGCSLQAASLIINLKGAFKSRHLDSKRAQYLNAALQNGFYLSVLAITLALVIGVMLSPLSPVILLGLGITASSLTTLSLMWPFLPSEIQKKFKSCLGISEENNSTQTELEELNALAIKVDKAADNSPVSRHSSGLSLNLFEVTKLKLLIVKAANDDLKLAKTTLISFIDENISRLEKHALLGQRQQNKDKPLTKAHQKIAIMTHLKEVVESNTKNYPSQVVLKDIDSLQNDYPKTFQSFYQRVSHTESLYEVVKFFIEHYASAMKSLENNQAKILISCI